MSNYIPLSESDRKQMLAAVGAASEKELFKDIPEELRLSRLNLPDGKSEQEVLDNLTALSEKNKVYKLILRGAGSYSHYIPPVVKQLASRSEFVTAYTPYQAEMSQGILRGIFEYQSMICALTGMDVSNASVYNGASACAEGCLMTLSRGKNKVVVANDIRPDSLAALKTYMAGKDAEVVVADTVKGLSDTQKLDDLIDEGTACVYLEQPSYYGLIEDAEPVSRLAKAKGAKFVMGVNPISLALLKTPAECGADIAVGEGQPLGLPMGFGGPYIGFMCCTSQEMRRLPGRIVGETTDRDGKKTYVLTLQAREQHIRRERASSNICSNQAHCALTAAIYLSALGKQGLKEVAANSVALSHYFLEKLQKIGLKRAYTGEFFHEFVTVSEGRADKILEALAAEGILGGLKLDADRILWCVTETAIVKTLDRAVGIIGGAL